MFNLLRYFSLTSAIVVVIATVSVITVYRYLAVDDIIETAEFENEGLTQSFADQIWPAFSPYFRNVDGAELEALRTGVETAALQLALETLTQGLPVLKVRIYTASGQLAFSSRIEEIGARDSGGADTGLTDALEGRTSSALLRRTNYVMPSGVAQDRHLVETFLPIIGPNSDVQGIFELHTDVTDLMVRIGETISGMVMAILMAFGAL